MAQLYRNRLLFGAMVTMIAANLGLVLVHGTGRPSLWPIALLGAFVPGAIVIAILGILGKNSAGE